MLYTLQLSLLFILPLVWAFPRCSQKTPKSGFWTSSAGSSAGSTGSNSPSDEIVASTWYAGWNGADFPPENVSWSKYSSVTYAFATTTPDVSTLSLLPSDEQLLPHFVDVAHQNGAKARLAIGGWTGSIYFSTAVGNAQNRTTFVQTILNLVSQYNLDGIDFDWEYPNKQGLGCNTINPSDSANFLSLLQELRSEPAGKNLTLSAAVSVIPFAGSSGTPMTDVSDFAKVLDYIEIMDYDVWGSWSTGVGPNAPLNDTCASASEQQGSAVSAVKAWTAANFPASQIVLAVASYGHSFFVPTSSAGSNHLAAYPSFNSSKQPAGDAWSNDSALAPGQTDQCGNPKTKSGVFDFWGMISGGFLSANGSAAEGMEYRFDNCSQTPYVYNPTSQVMISYDNAQSFAAKGHFINDAGLAGFAMWQTGGDYNDILLDSITEAIGIDDC